MKTVRFQAKLLSMTAALFFVVPKIVNPVYANMLPANPQQAAVMLSYGILGIILILFITPLANSFVEAFVAGRVLRVEGGKLKKIFLKINFISYYPTLIILTLAGNILGQFRQNQLPFLIAEVFVVFFEYLLLRWQLKKFMPELWVKIRGFRALSVIILVNMASILAGIILINLFGLLPNLF